jgi:creatinine amidohydrolase
MRVPITDRIAGKVCGLIQLPKQWAELTTTDFAEPALRDAVAILPVAAIEQHGPHLPLATDAIINQGVIDAACASPGIRAVVLPMQAIGTSHEHLAFPGTLSFDAGALIAQWTRIGEGVRRAGLRKLLIFNSHGGQVGLPEIVATDLRARLGMVVAWASPGAFGAPEGEIIDPVEAAHGLHGGLKETAMMLHLRPDLVRVEAISVFASRGERMETDFRRLRATGRTGHGWQTQDLNPAGVVGNAAAATPELGARLIRHAAQGLVEMIYDMVRFELPAE